MDIASDPAALPPDLPPIENLGAESDFTPFLRPGVPKALRQAALRRAWTAKPAISSHRPLVEYDWDFNAPGYGRLRPEDNAEALVAGLFKGLRRVLAEKADRAPEDPASLEDPAAPPAAAAGNPETPAVPPEGPTELTEPPQHSTDDTPEAATAESGKDALPPPQTTRSEPIRASPPRGPRLPEA